MNKAEYQAYQKAVDNFFKKERITNLTTMEGTCSWCEEDIDSDPWFSCRPCECCGSPLGGDRYHATAWHEQNNQVLCFEVCQDCLYYAEYGQLDDMAMMDMEDLADCDICGAYHALGGLRGRRI